MTKEDLKEKPKSLLDVYGTDPDLEEEGVWVKMFEGAEVCIRAFNNKKHKAMLERLRGPYKQQIQRGTLSDDIDEEIHLKAFCKTVLVNWRGDGIQDPDTGEVIPYSYENAIKLLKDDRLKRFKNDCMFISTEQETFKLATTEEAIKNSEKSSSGASDSKKSPKSSNPS